MEKRKVKSPDTTLPQCIICDLDGTVAINQDRGWYDYEKVKYDTFDPRIKYLLERAINDGVYIIFLTGREAIPICKEATYKWIEDNMGSPIVKKMSGFDKTYEILMREEKDHRPDNIVKKEIYKNNIEGVYNVLFVLEDRKKVIDMYREMGLLTFQVYDEE